MKKLSFLFIIYVFIISVVSFSFKSKPQNFKENFISYLSFNTKHLLISYDSLYLYLDSSKTIDIARARELFLNLRYQYKKSEFAIEYFAPSTASMLNMALIPDVDEFDPNQNTIEPEGLQIIEQALFEKDSIEDLSFIVNELKRTRGVVLRFQQIVKTMEPLDFQILEACKLELIRIWAINLTGMDASYTLNSIKESNYALSSLSDVLEILLQSNPNYRLRLDIASCNKKILKARNYLATHTDFEKLDRIYFVKNLINPLYASFVELQKNLNAINNLFPSAIYSNSKSIFSKESWNMIYFSNDKKLKTNSSQIELGRILFYDPILSGNNERACASCHRPEHGFAESLETSISFSGNKQLNRNAPTILNTIFQKSYFWDSRLSYIEDQVVAVNQNKDEMHGDFSEIVYKLNASSEYKSLFHKAFHGSADTLISKTSIIKAIVSFERSLVSFNSKFDRYMRSEKVSLNQNEVNGFNLFMGKAQCGTCHFAPFFNGTVPPNFEETESEIIGVPNNSKNLELDSDYGKYNATGMELHKFAFKTPTIRNVSYTSPYMHNGIYKTLEEVVEFYNSGGGLGHGYNVPNQTLPSDSLKLTKSEVSDIVSFMNTLSDTVGLTRKPSRLPKVIINGNIITRKVGGEY